MCVNVCCANQRQPTTATTTKAITWYKQTLGPRFHYIPPFVSTLKGTNKHWDPVVVIWGAPPQQSKIIYSFPFPAEKEIIMAGQGKPSIGHPGTWLKPETAHHFYPLKCRRFKIH